MRVNLYLLMFNISVLRTFCLSGLGRTLLVLNVLDGELSDDEDS